MRFFSLSAMLVSISLTYTGTAVAQQRFQGRTADNWWHDGVGQLGLIQVRDELNLSEEQTARIKEIGDDFIQKHYRPFLESARKLTLDEQLKKLDELRKPEREANERARQILTTEQSGRFRQIEIWLNGLSAFDDAQLAKELDLTDQQRGALKTISDEYWNEVTALNKSLRFGPGVRPSKADLAQRQVKLAEADKQGEKLLVTKMDECLAALTDEQRTQFLKLRGPKFELKRRQLPNP